jgi:hypothetical protein
MSHGGQRFIRLKPLTPELVVRRRGPRGGSGHRCQTPDPVPENLDSSPPRSGESGDGDSGSGHRLHQIWVGDGGSGRCSPYTEKVELCA